jgi:hypothetical protein
MIDDRMIDFWLKSLDFQKFSLSLHKKIIEVNDVIRNPSP